MPAPAGSTTRLAPHKPLLFSNTHDYIAMGNCCGSVSKTDGNFGGEGRVLGAAPAQSPPSNPPRASVPANVGAQKLGGSGGNSSAAADAARKAAIVRPPAVRFATNTDLDRSGQARARELSPKGQARRDFGAAKETDESRHPGAGSGRGEISKGDGSEHKELAI